MSSAGLVTHRISCIIKSIFRLPLGTQGDVAVEVAMAPEGGKDVREGQGKGVVASGPGMRRGSAKIVALPCLGREEL